MRPHYKLAMIGDGPLYNDVSNLASQLYFKNSISIMGFMDGFEKQKLFLNSCVFAHPVIYDTCGLAPVEAMVFGVPADVSKDLLARQEIRKISFTGSVGVGKHLAQMAAQTANPQQIAAQQAAQPASKDADAAGAIAAGA
jgi:glycosyltransferase involved in cell wall biosynthesis